MTRVSGSKRPKATVMHKFTENGVLAKAVDKKTRLFFESRVMQTCARVAPPLPPPVAKAMNHLTNELVYLRDQALNIAELQLELIQGRPSGTSAIVAFGLTQMVFLTSMDHPKLAPVVEKMAPTFLHWYRTIVRGPARVAGDIKARVGDYQRSRSIFLHTPQEAKWAYKAEVIRRGRAPSASPNTVLVEFFPNLQKGKYGSSSTAEPDFVTVGLLHPSRGLELRSVRERLGVESLAIVTDKGPFRPTFEVVNEDWLSPLAVLDLTKQFTKPIRVYEPRVARATRVTRAIRVPVFLACIFLVALARLLCGIPERDTAYLQAVFGGRPVRAYTTVGSVTSAVNHQARKLAYGVGVACAAPIFVLFATLCICARLVQVGVQTSYNTTCTVVPAMASAAKSTVSRARALDRRSWLIMTVVCWWTVADIYACMH